MMSSGQHFSAYLGKGQTIGCGTEAAAAAGLLHRLERHATHTRLPERVVDDAADLSVIEPALQRGDQCGGDAQLVASAGARSQQSQGLRLLGQNYAMAASPGRQGYRARSRHQNRDLVPAGASRGSRVELSIENGVGDVTTLSSVNVSPAQTTQYTLTATNGAGSTSARVTVTVSQPVTSQGPTTPTFLTATGNNGQRGGIDVERQHGLPGCHRISDIPQRGWLWRTRLAPSPSTWIR